MMAGAPDGPAYTPEAAAARIATLQRHGIWPGMIPVPGTDLVRLTHDPDVAGERPRLAAARLEAGA